MKGIGSIGTILLFLVTLAYSQTTLNEGSTTETSENVPLNDNTNSDTGLPAGTNPSDLDLFAINSDPFASVFGNSVGIDFGSPSGGETGLPIGDTSGVNNEGNNVAVDESSNNVGDINNTETAASTVVDKTVDAGVEESVLPALGTAVETNEATTAVETTSSPASVDITTASLNDATSDTGSSDGVTSASTSEDAMPSSGNKGEDASAADDTSVTLSSVDATSTINSVENVPAMSSADVESTPKTVDTTTSLKNVDIITMPKSDSTTVPEVDNTTMPIVEDTTMPNSDSTTMPKADSTTVQRVDSTSMVDNTITPIVEGTTMPNSDSTTMPEADSTTIQHVESSTMQHADTTSTTAPKTNSGRTDTEVTAASLPRPSTPTHRSWTHLCDKCDSLDQTCLFPHPSDCQVFIECFRQGEGWTATPMLCGQGTFFSKKKNGCDHVSNAECQYDKCTMEKSTETYKHYMDKNCATYWECDTASGMSRATCCPEGQAYIQGHGCVEDENCTAQCPTRRNVTDEVIHTNVFKENGKCNANVYLNFNQPTIMNESPKQKMVFVKSGGEGRVRLVDGTGVFNGRTYMFVPFYNHNSYQVKKAFIQLRFHPRDAGQDNQVLVSTCSTNYNKGASPSIEIKMDKVNRMLIFTGVTQKGTVQFDLPYRDDQWNGVQFVYDGVNTFTALVQPETDTNDIQKKEVVLEGVTETNPLLKPTMDLRIGSCFRGAWRGDVDDYFHGEMDDIYIASCVPEIAA